jgi:hypothetical protein
MEQARGPEAGAGDTSGTCEAGEGRFSWVRESHSMSRLTGG